MEFFENLHIPYFVCPIKLRQAYCHYIFMLFFLLLWSRSLAIPIFGDLWSLSFGQVEGESFPFSALQDPHLAMSLSMLRSCSSCAEHTAATLCCARCRTLYCSRPCQVAHWTSGGHQKACKGIARAHRDTNIEVQSRALARVAHMSGGVPDDALCLICIDMGGAVCPLVRGCVCWGSVGWAHVTCQVKSVEVARAPAPGEPTFAV